ncbi:MAG TPA: hypothetical protein VGO92_00300 [Acidimicrobiales bacterium]|nr:hypothetical protein [Acidimicrobiales bacterium]
MSQPAVIFGGPSPEHDVSILTGLQAARALGPGAIAVYWAKTGDFFEVDPALEGQDFVDGVPRRSAQLRLSQGDGFVKKKRLDISAAVNCCHGGPGEDGTLQAALDLAGVRYTGPNVAAAALGMDKLAFADVVAAAGIPTLPRAALTPDLQPGFDGPYIVKPRFGGSSIGISVAADLDTAKALLASDQHLRAGAVVEPYRPDAVDVNIGVRTWPQLQLSGIEKPLRQAGSAILGYADKYVGGEGMVSAPREFPAVLPPAIDKAVKDAAERIAGLAGLRGVARIDFLLDGDELYVNEVNTIPGSLSKYLWDVPFEQLLRDLLDEAERRPTFHWTTAGADGAALRSAGSIAGKLG